MPTFPEGNLQTQVAHHGANHRSLQGPRFLTRTRDDVQKLVAVDDPAQVIDHDEAITVAIERESDMGPNAGHRELQQIRRRRSAAVVDVAAVGRAADGNDLRAEVGQHARADFVGRAVCAIDHDLHARQINAGFDRRGAELLVDACVTGRHASRGPGCGRFA